MANLQLLDARVLEFFNQFAGRSWTFDAGVVLLSANNLLKGGLLMSAFWWAWYQEGANRITRNREILLFTLACCPVGVLIARGLALALPFRARPLHDPALHFHLPYELNPELLEGWSSFPSDHAVLFFTLATGLTLVCRRVGVLALFYVVVFICLPRVYLGIH